MDVKGQAMGYQQGLGFRRRKAMAGTGAYGGRRICPTLGHYCPI